MKFILKYIVIGALLGFIMVTLQNHFTKHEFNKYCIQVDSLQNEIPSDAYLCGKEIEKIWA